MIRLGRAEIHRIEEIVLREDSSLFREWEKRIGEAYRDLLVPHCYDPDTDTFASSIHAWLVKLDGLTILIDTVGGNGKPRPASPRFDRLDQPFLENLASAGATPEDVDYVLLTHLHVDHVGWNTFLVDGRWVPTFPNAVYVMTRTERDWRDPEMGASGKPEAATLPFRDSVRPVLEQAKVRIVEGDEQLLDGIDFIKIPGHAPGMMGVRLRSEGREALFVADVMHQPIQVHYPSWNSKYCEDGDTARETRARILDYCADKDILVLPAHFGAPHCGYVVREGDGYGFRPADQMP